MFHGNFSSYNELLLAPQSQILKNAHHTHKMNVYDSYVSHNKNLLYRYRLHQRFLKRAARILRDSCVHFRNDYFEVDLFFFKLKI
jgi:hypothetical protein